MTPSYAGLSGEQAVSHKSETAEEILLWLLVGALAWVPYWYGSNDLIAWGANAVLFPGLAGLYELWILAGARAHPIGVRSLIWPAALFAAVVAWISVQTMIVGHSPPAHPVWDVAADALGRPLVASISVNRDLTVLALIRLITAASVFWLTLQLCRNSGRAARFLDAVAVIVCVYAGYGLAIFALDSGQMPWLEHGTINGHAASALSSTFVNHNSFATYAGLGLIVVCGMLLRLYERAFVDVEGPHGLRVAIIIEAAGHRGALLLAGAFLLLAALLLTGSRGGVISTGVGVVVLGLLVLMRGEARSRGFIGLAVLAAAGGAVAMFGFGDPLAAGLAQRGIGDAGRMAVYLITLWSILDAPLLGYGYGTFADVFPMYRDRSIAVQGAWQQAHNTYLEVLQGLGLAFGTMLVACVLLLVISCIKGAVTRQGSVTAPRVAAGAAFLVGVHSLVDFSLQIQAVALTFAAILGVGVAQAASSRATLHD